MSENQTNTVDLLGEEVLIKKIAERTLDGQFVSSHLNLNNYHYLYQFFTFSGLPITNIYLPNNKAFGKGFLANTNIEHFNFLESFPSVNTFQNIPDFFLAYCYNLRSAIFNYTNSSSFSISSHAFSKCINLETISLPTFQSNPNSMVYNFSENSLDGCLKLRNIIGLEKVGLLRLREDSGCYRLQIPKTSLAVWNGSKLSYAVFDEVNIINNNTSYWSQNQSAFFHAGYKIVLEDQQMINPYWFYISSIRILELSSATEISFNNNNGRNAFYSGFLEYLVVGENNEGITTLSTFDVSKIQHIHYRVYVPDTLLDDYKVASNWSLIADKIYPISEYQNLRISPSLLLSDFISLAQEIHSSSNQEQYLGIEHFVYIPFFGMAKMACIKVNADIKENGELAKTTWLATRIICKRPMFDRNKVYPLLDVVKENDGYSYYGDNVDYHYIMNKDYYDSDLYELLNDAYLEMDNSLRQYIVPVLKDTMGVDNGKLQLKQSYESLWIPSYYEMVGNYSSVGERTGISYFSNQPNSSLNRQWVSSAINNDNPEQSFVSFSDYWLRTMGKPNLSSVPYKMSPYYMIYNGGNQYSYPAMQNSYGSYFQSRGVIIGFCLD